MFSDRTEHCGINRIGQRWILAGDRGPPLEQQRIRCRNVTKVRQKHSNRLFLRASQGDLAGAANVNILRRRVFLQKIIQPTEPLSVPFVIISPTVDNIVRSPKWTSEREIL